MAEKQGNVTLIGMPGAGKSSIGILSARSLNRNFLDTDLLLQQQTGKTISELIAETGFEGFLEQEEKLLLSLDCRNTVIATGGSAVYSYRAMTHLSKSGPILYIEVPLQMLMFRVPDLHARGVAVQPDMSYVDLYNERLPLYEQSATATFAPAILNVEDSATSVARLIRRLEEPFVPVG